MERSSSVFSFCNPLVSAETDNLKFSLEPSLSKTHGSENKKNNSISLNKEKNVKASKSPISKKESFFELAYKPGPLQGYISYNKTNSFSIHFQKKSKIYTALSSPFFSLLTKQKHSNFFVVLDKNADITTLNSWSNSSVQKEAKPLLNSSFPNESSLLPMRQGRQGLWLYPESFFGSPYLQLGERFTIEKQKGKSQMGVLYNVHNGDKFAPVNKTASPYSNTGTSLKTVFGKRLVQQTSKKPSKTQSSVTTGRLVSQFHIEKKGSWFNKNSVSSFLFNEKALVRETNTLKKLFYFKRISGKANRNITLPFKYYNPGIKRDRNIEDTMLTLEGYKKSRLFPKIHAHYQGIAADISPIREKFILHKAIYENKDQGIDLQSILGGGRQRTESGRIAENLSDPSKTSSDLNKREASFLEGHEKEPGNIQQKRKKFNSTNYYPIRTLFTVSSQKQKTTTSLGPTDAEYNNFSDTPTLKGNNLKGSARTLTKGFYVEKIFTTNFLLSQSNFGIKKEKKFTFLNNYIYKTWGGTITLWSSFSKILFFATVWYSYKNLATPLTQSTQFLPATFTEAIGLQSFQKKYRIITPLKTKQNFKSLAGAEKTLSELRDLIWTFRLVGTGGPGGTHSTFASFPYIGDQAGKQRSTVLSRSRNRFLLVGPPGTGKTLLVKALAAEANVPVIVQPVSQLRMISGVENPVSALFHVARQIKPCIIFLDELDTLGNDVETSTAAYTAEQKLGIKLARKYTYTLLLELDGLNSETRDLLIIGATNRPETLNPALTRAGRFETIINCNLPSQEQRLAVLSLYLSFYKQKSENNQNLIKQTSLSKPVTSISSIPPSKLQPSPSNGWLTKNKDVSSTFNQNLVFSKKQDNTFWLNYLARKCYGLSQASIGTVVNESALESMLQKNKSLHTLETLERAIESVRILTSQQTNYSAFLGPLPSTTNISGIEKKTSASILSKGQKKPTLKEKHRDCTVLAKPLLRQFLVYTAYQNVGSLVFLQLQEQVNSTFFISENKKGQSLLEPKKQNTKQVRVTTQAKKAKNSIKQNHSKFKDLSFNQNIAPSDKQGFEIALLQQYAGGAAASVYSATRPLLKFANTSGLYNNPAGIGQNLLMLKSLIEKTFTTDISAYNSIKKTQEQKRFFSSTVALEKTLFVSETELIKQTFPNLLSIENNSKQGSFFTSQKFENNNNIYPLQQQLSRFSQVKLNNPLTTGWFRIYLSRPFFRYDSAEYIENKEYYPQNNYLTTQKPRFRNVATLAHRLKVSPQTKSLDSMNRFVREPNNNGFSNFGERKLLTFWEQDQIKPVNQQAFDPMDHAPKGQGVKGKMYQQNEAKKKISNVSKTKKTNLLLKTNSGTTDSLYLAIVAYTFHKASLLAQKNRELLDYCVYNTLRYGVLYEFSVNTISKRF